MVVDMLNYGAEAQKNAGYNLDNLANSLLSEEQKAFATKTVAFKNEMSFTGAGKYMRKVEIDLSDNIGIVEMNAAGNAYRVVWGFDDSGRPTSEFETHLLIHEICSKLSDGDDRVVYKRHMVRQNREGQHKLPLMLPARTAIVVRVPKTQVADSELRRNLPRRRLMLR
jgi:hypothetical protein